jgi:hypothetical protein
MKDRSGDGLLRWSSITCEGASMIEPMLTDLAEAVRRLSAAEQLAARVAGHAHAQSCCAHCTSVAQNLKSRATYDSTVRPRSPTDVPTPSGQLTCRIRPDNCYKLHAEAIRGCNLDQIARLPW